MFARRIPLLYHSPCKVRWRIKDEPGSERSTPEQIKELTEARRLYRQLRLNYDPAGEYEVAGQFYVFDGGVDRIGCLGTKGTELGWV